MSIPQRPTRKQAPSGAGRRAPPPPPTPGSPPPPYHSVSLPPPPPLPSPVAPPSIVSPVFLPTRLSVLQRGEPHPAPPPLPSPDSTYPPPPPPARSPSCGPLPSRPLSMSSFATTSSVVRNNNSPPLPSHTNNINFSKPRKSQDFISHERESAHNGDRHSSNAIFSAINRSPHNQSHTPTSTSSNNNSMNISAPIITTSLSPSSSSSSSSSSTAAPSSSSTLPLPSQDGPESNRDLKNIIDMISLNSWQNEAWTRSLANRTRRIAPPTKRTDEETGGTGDLEECEDLAGMIERISRSLWCNFCAQNLQFHSASLDSQDWLDSTCSRLAHMLEIFLLMNTDLRCKCTFAPATTTKEESGGNVSNGNNGNNDGNTLNIRTNSSSSPLLERSLMKPSKWQMMDGSPPTAAMLEESHDCLLLFLHAFLAEEGPVLLLFLITDLLQFEKIQSVSMSDTQAMHKVVESSLECIVKILWILQRVCTRQTCTVKGTIRVGSCEGVRVCKVRVSAAAWTNRDKLMWWMEGGVEEALLCMAPLGVPERVGITLMELLLDHITPIQDQSYTPFHIKKIADVSILPLLTTVCLLSKFDYLENILKYLTFLVVQKPENALVLARADSFMFIMPSLLTGGTSCPQNKQLRINEPRLAEERVGSILRNAIGLIMSVVHIYFTSVDTTVQNECSSAAAAASSSSSSSVTPTSLTANSIAPALSSPINDSSSSSNNSSSANNNNNNPMTLCALLFSMLDCLEDTAHKWDQDTIARANVIFYSLLIKLTKNVRIIKRDIKSFMWESIFQLCFAIEDHVWYSACASVPRASPRHFKTFELRGTAANAALIVQLDELLAALEPAVQGDEFIERTPIEKRRVDLLRARLTEERDFWALSSDLISISNNMDSETLLQDRRYKIVEISSRQRCSHYGDPTLSSKILPPLHVWRSPRSPGGLSRTLDSTHRNSRILLKEERKHHTLGATSSSSTSAAAAAAVMKKNTTVDLSKLSRFVVKHIKEISETTTSNTKKTLTKEDAVAFSNAFPNRSQRAESAEDNTQAENNINRNRQKRAGSGTDETNSNNNRQKRTGSGVDDNNNNNNVRGTRDVSPLKPPQILLLQNANCSPNISQSPKSNNEGNEIEDLPGPPGPPPPSDTTSKEKGVRPLDILCLSLEPSNPRDMITVTDHYLDAELNPKYWKQHFDPEGNSLYFNCVTKTLSTDKPPCLKDREAPVDCGIWEEYTDPSGEAFFFNPLISQATYDDPFLPRASKSSTPRSSRRSHSPSFPASSLSPQPPGQLPSPRPLKFPTLTIPTVSQHTPNKQLVDDNDFSLLPLPSKEALEWREAFDATSGGHYFYNKATQETRSECPECLLPFNLPQYWEENVSEGSERPFYFNMLTKLSTFVRPLCLDKVPMSSEFVPGSLDGWREAVDPDESLFWYNKHTGESTFERPRFMPKVDAAWKSVVDDATGRVYWFNSLTLQSTWNQPRVCKKLFI